MLGDLISEEKGKVTSQREPKIETSFSATGNYRGVDTTATVRSLKRGYTAVFETAEKRQRQFRDQ
jgi:hypothetical protein